MRKEIKSSDDKDFKEIKTSTSLKALFSQRLLAFVIDVIILSFVSSLIISFVPVNNTASKLYDEQNEILESYVDGIYSMEDYVNKMIDIEYDISKYTVISSLIAIVISLLYYVVYPCYNNGQTFGKKY